MKKGKIDKIDDTKTFLKQISRVSNKLKNQFQIRLEKFIVNNSDSVLHNHQLTGKLKEYRSININGDWRALYSIKIVDDKTIIVFEALGTHSQLYR
jgi:addiction module RelE/StbE family toxin